MLLSLGDLFGYVLQVCFGFCFVWVIRLFLHLTVTGLASRIMFGDFVLESKRQTHSEWCPLVGKVFGYDQTSASEKVFQQKHQRSFVFTLRK